MSSGYQVRPVLEAILLHPDLHTGARMVKPPVVLLAGLLRLLQASIDGEYWIWYSENAGQRLFYPPDVSGWDDSRWLDTSTIRGRFELVSRALADRVLDGRAVDDYDETETPEAGVAAARAWAGDPNLTSETVALLTAFAADALAGAGGWQLSTYRGLRQNALRHLDPRLPRLPDELTMANCGCNDYSRTQLLRRAAAEAGQGPPGDRAGDAAAGRHGADPSLVRLPRDRSGAVGLRRREPRPEGHRAGDRRRGGAGAGERPHPRLGLSLRRRGCAHAARAHERASAVRELAAEPRSPGGAGHAADGGPVAPLASVARGARRALRRGQGERHAGDRLRPTRTSRISPRGTSGRSARRTRSAAGAGSAATSTITARPTTRSRDSPSAGTSSRCWPRRACPWRPWPSRTTTTSGRPGVWGTVQDKMLDAFGDLGEAATSDVGLGPGALRRGGDGAAARPARAVPGRVHDPGRRDLPDAAASRIGCARSRR